MPKNNFPLIRSLTEIIVIMAVLFLGGMCKNIIINLRGRGRRGLNPGPGEHHVKYPTNWSSDQLTNNGSYDFSFVLFFLFNFLSFDYA